MLPLWDRQKSVPAKREKQFLKEHGLEDKMEHAAHIAWATGGRLVPEAVRRQYYEKSRSLG